MSIAPKLSKGGFAAIIKMQPSFKTSLDALENNIFDTKQRFDTITFTEELVKLREALLKEQLRSEQDLPKNINPL